MSHVLVVGAGAIGSHVLPHLARSPHVSRVTVVDRDRYDSTNLTGQDIESRFVGRAKALVQVRRLRQINPHLRVSALCTAVEDLPLGALRATVILGCVDSRRARMTVNQAAWRLAIPWIDAGVDGGSLLARVQVFVPAADAPCLECAWDPADYESVEQRYPCQGDILPAPTTAPSTLGALAAALQGIECDKLLTGNTEGALIGRNVMLDARYHKHYVTTFRRNPVCRMPDHGGWRIEPFGTPVSESTLGDVFALGSTIRGAARRLSFRVAGQRFTVTMFCPGCDQSQTSVQLERRVRRASGLCSRCGHRLQSTGFDSRDSLLEADVPADLLDQPLSTLGLRRGDVFSLCTPVVDAHFELGGEA